MNNLIIYKEMIKEFDYKEFANVLRFQVRGLVPEQFKDKEQALQSLIFEDARILL